VVTRPFPLPERLVQSAYRELQIAQYGSAEEQEAVGRPETLDRPWDPPSCKPAVRQQVWAWLEEVAAWVNHEYGWGVDRLIPACWPAHPPIAHELAMLADQRRTAGIALVSDPLEEWHRYSLPLFLDRMVARLGNRCVTRHEQWPASARYRAYCSDETRRERIAWFGDDLNGSRPDPTAYDPPLLALVEVSTGEVIPPRAPNGGR